MLVILLLQRFIKRFSIVCVLVVSSRVEAATTIATAPQYPLVFSRHYSMDLRHLGQPSYDGAKGKRVVKELSRFDAGLAFYAPVAPVTHHDLLALNVHTSDYLATILDGKHTQTVVEWGQKAIAALSFEERTRRILTPQLWAAAGTYTAVQLALFYGWAVQLGGGFHRAHPGKGASLCLYSDIFYAIYKLWQEHDSNLRVFIIDVDAHYGDGTAAFAAQHREKVALYDVYSSASPSYPSTIGSSYSVSNGAGGAEYLKIFKSCLQARIDAFKPHLIMYNAGANVLKGTAPQSFRLSAQDLLSRDKIVADIARKGAIPWVYLLSGGKGYYQKSARTRALSLCHIIANNKGVCALSLSPVTGMKRRHKRSVQRVRVTSVTQEQRAIIEMGCYGKFSGEKSELSYAGVPTNQKLHHTTHHLSPYTLRTAHNQQQPKTLVPLPPHSLVVKHYASAASASHVTRHATLMCTVAVGLCAIIAYRHRCSTNTNK